MAGASTDKFKKAANNFSTTLNGSIGSGDTTIALTSVTNLPTDTGIVLVIDRVDGTGTLTPTLREYVKGVISSNNLINVSRGVGNSTAQSHSSGAVVECVPDQVTQNDFVDGILVGHNQDGTHATSLPLTTPVLTTPTIKTYDGWITAVDTWTYASADSTNKTYTFKISGVDRTGVISVGDRIKLTQSSTVAYFLVTKTAFSTDTTVTIYGGTDYALANSAISSPFYSHDKAPNGFPLDPTKWTVTTSSANDRTPGGTSYASLTDNLVVPIGAWKLSLKVSIFYTVASTTTPNGAITLSSDGSTETNPKLTIANQWQGSSAASSIGGGYTGRTEDDISVASATTFTLMGKRSAGTFQVLGSTITPTVIKAVCAYI